MLADHRPLVVVGGRVDAVGADGRVVLNGHAQAEEGLDAALHQRGDQEVGKGEIVGVGIGGIAVEIPKDVGHVHPAEAAVRPAHVVQTGKRHARLGQVVEHIKVRAKKRRLTHAVHGLDPPHGGM